MKITHPSHLVKDLVQGDASVAERKDYLSLTQGELREALQLLVTNPHLSDLQKKQLLVERWRINYRVKPPSIEDFLTEEYLGDVANSLYPYVKDILVQFWEPSKPYRNLLLAPHIGFGKSFISVITNLYISTVLWCMRNPTQYFPGLSRASQITQILLSFTLDKAKELLLDPFKRILATSLKFHRVRTEEALEKRQKDVGDTKIVWTTAGTMALQFGHGVSIKIASDADTILGLSVISGTVSEISFFADRGYSYDEIWRVYSDLKKRIFSRFTGHYFSRSILDSSPNSMENPIDKYIHGDGAADLSNFIVTGAMWDWQPWKFNLASGTFAVYPGSGNKSPCILGDEVDTDAYDAEDILRVPKFDVGGTDMMRAFDEDLLKALKDIGGISAGGDDKFIQQREKIDLLFTPFLRNVLGGISAPHDRSPERLIWDQVVGDFFEKQSDRYYFWRNPKEIRFVAVDQSIADDSTALVMLHPELGMRGETIDVVDFTLVIQPRRNRVNLEAIELFLKDLVRVGNIKLGMVSFDRFQSESTLQSLDRMGIRTQRLSVDASMGPYMSLVGAMYGERVKVGRNIFLRNNLRSLRVVQTQSGKRKVDHLTGKNIRGDNLNWETSGLGFYAKDVSDALAGALELRSQHFRGVPKYIYDEGMGCRGETAERQKYEERLALLGLRRRS